MNLLSQIIDTCVQSARSSKLWFNVSFINLIIRSIVLAPVIFWSVVPSIVAHFRCSQSFSLLNLLSHGLCYLRPVRATYDHSKTNIKYDASNTKPEPKTLNSHLCIKSKDQSKRHSNNIIAYQGIDRPKSLSAKTPDDSWLYSVDCVEPDVDD